MMLVRPLCSTSTLILSQSTGPFAIGSRRWLSANAAREDAGGKGAAAPNWAGLPQPVSKQQTLLFNSLTKKKEPLPPLPQAEPLTWYTCGPTVYDHAHIGHARAYVGLDIVRRVLMQQGYCIFQVMGMTDIDDKIISKAKEQGLPGVQGVAQVSRHFEHEFLCDMATLNVLPPDAITRVTDFVPDIVQFVCDLEAKGFVYRGARTGSLWFDTVAYGSRYGALEPSRGFGSRCALIRIW